MVGVLTASLVPCSLIASDGRPQGNTALAPATGGPHPGQPGGHDHGRHAHGAPEGGDPHVHAPVPPEYQAAHLPAAAWTNPRLITRGREIFLARCALCHGDNGDGRGPAAAGLPIRPPSFRDERMAGEMAGNYWFWRVSEGGLVEPFASMGSVMPAWKDELSVIDRWAVIAYAHTLSGHQGPHVVSEHPQMLGGHAGDGAEGAGEATRPGEPAPGAHKP